MKNVGVRPGRRGAVMPAIPGRRLVLPLVLALLCGLFAPLAVPAQPAHAAAPAFVQQIGSNTGGQPITITTTAAVTAGNSIIVALDTVNAGLGTLTPGVPTCSDPVNGTYDVDVTAVLDLASDLRMTVCSKHNAAA